MRGTATICLGGENLDNLSDMEAFCSGGGSPGDEESDAFFHRFMMIGA